MLVEGNSATNGGGLYLAFNQLTMINTTLRANTATNQGGGLWIDKMSPTVYNSQVYDNTAAQGGGLALGDALLGLFERTEIYSNTADQGGGIFTRSSYSFNLADSYLRNNHATTEGGAIYSSKFATMVISRTVIEANSAGLYCGGLIITGTDDFLPMRVVENTFSRNTAQSGGAIYHHDAFVNNHSLLVLQNSTLSDNAVNHDGGGLYAIGDAHTWAYNTTIANNRLSRPLVATYPSRGGGVFITSTAILTAQNTLIANNLRTNNVSQSAPDDCFMAVTTSLHSLGYNLIETTTNCTISGLISGNVTGQDPKLGPLQNNGGSTPTRALLPGSPAIDAGHPSGCINDLGTALTIDQRGWRRPIGPRCDIGAVEYSPYAIDLPLIQR